MKKILLACACLAMLITTACGSGEKKKDIKVEVPKELPGYMSEVIEFVDTTSVYSFTNDTEGAISEQNWTIEVPVNVLLDDPAFAQMADAMIPEMTLTVYDKDGKEVGGQKDYVITPENRKALSELFTKGKGTRGVIKFTHQTNAKDTCDKMFEDGTTAKITFKKGSSSSSSESSSSSFGGGNSVPADMNPADALPADEAPEYGGFEAEAPAF